LKGLATVWVAVFLPVVAGHVIGEGFVCLGNQSELCLAHALFFGTLVRVILQTLVTVRLLDFFSSSLVAKCGAGKEVCVRVCVSHPRHEGMQRWRRREEEPLEMIAYNKGEG
jgi:hypothetical protein